MKFIIIFLSFFGIIFGGDLAMANSKYEEAIFAMGCFWCGESEFRNHDDLEPLNGIITTRVGYAGGITPNPTYENHEGYKEAVKVIYNPEIITYEELLDIFWHNVDPFNNKGQFCDTGPQYSSAIYYKDENQKERANSTKESTQKILNQGEILTEIIPYTTFYDAEEYHQNYKQKNPTRYSFYRWNCGRDKRLSQIWHGASND